MDPTDVDRRFAELVTAEFGEGAMRGDHGAPHEADVEVAEPGKPEPRTPEPRKPQPRISQPRMPESAPPVRVESAGDVEPADDVDYRSPGPRPPLPADIRIAAAVLAVGLVVLLLAGFVLNVPANLVWVGPVAAGGGVVWLLVRALRRPPRDPDDDGIHL
ncbi:hypothetical protein ACSDQ9_10880 [Aestuariimicrobium soli]|uniref:hypothetical protein n=1 Tax=Aestuariimicrobium soli TaxID=2035834 RepID=UPI003EBC7E73